MKTDTRKKKLNSTDSMKEIKFVIPFSGKKHQAQLSSLIPMKHLRKKEYQSSREKKQGNIYNLILCGQHVDINI